MRDRVEHKTVTQRVQCIAEREDEQFEHQHQAARNSGYWQSRGVPPPLSPCEHAKRHDERERVSEIQLAAMVEDSFFQAAPGRKSTALLELARSSAPVVV